MFTNHSNTFKATNSEANYTSSTPKTFGNSKTFAPKFSGDFKPTAVRRTNYTEMMHNYALRFLSEEIVNWGMNGNMDDMREAFRLITQTDFCIEAIRKRKSNYRIVYFNKCSDKVKNWYKLYVNCLNMPYNMSFDFTENEAYSYTNDNNEHIDCIRSYVTFRYVPLNTNPTAQESPVDAESKTETKVEAKVSNPFEG